MTRGRVIVATFAVLAALVATGLPAVAGSSSGAAASAAPALVIQSLSFTSSDGTVLHASVAGNGSLDPRPLIVEDSPYAPAPSTLSWAGSQFNLVELQWRGTGLSGGSLDAGGTQDQTDLSQFLGWACDQPWSNGSIGLYGFSASAIVVYNAMHLPLPCVKTAALMAGSTDLYRDLLDIGGIPNIAAGVFVEASIGSDTLENGLTRLEDEPSTIPAAVLGYLSSGADVLTNSTEDAFWQQRTFQGDLDQIPVLADTSFYDVEPDGPFALFNATKQFGSHLLVYGAHDGFPAGLPGPFPQYENWFDHYLLNQPLNADNQPVVSAYLSNGSRAQFLAGNVTHLTDTAWPLTGTAWTDLYLSGAHNSSVASLNSGSLTTQPANTTKQLYPFLPSEVTETDLHNTALLDSELDEIGQALPQLNDMALSNLTSLTYTSPPLTQPFTMVGPGALDVQLSSLEPVTDIYAVVADVAPDGTAYPVATGALRTSFPNILPSCSLSDTHADVVDPCNDYSSTSNASPGTTRTYQVELLPMGNVFSAGSRLRLYILGTPLDQVPSLPGLNTVTLGGASGSRLILPGLGAPQF
ncbi:MAG TPA: CocE/NonD family hydrolase [Acidimicrobiales bacterium]